MWNDMKTYSEAVMNSPVYRFRWIRMTICFDDEHRNNSETILAVAYRQQYGKITTYLFFYCLLPYRAELA